MMHGMHGNLIDWQERERKGDRIVAALEYVLILALAAGYGAAIAAALGR